MASEPECPERASYCAEAIRERAKEVCKLHEIREANQAVFKGEKR